MSTRSILAVQVSFGVWCVCAMASAQLAKQPPAAREIRVEEHLGAQLPLDVSLSDTFGKRVHLSDLVRGDLPVVLVLGYARCTMLCSVLLRGVGNTVSELDTLRPGRDYRLVLVSIDPEETVDEAARKQTLLLEHIGYPGRREQWPYLVGAVEQVKKLADALGFKYAWDERSEQYAHPAVIFVLTPTGRVASYLYGIQPSKAELASALTAAANGRTESSLASELMRCFRFEPGARKYQERIQAYFRVGALLVFCLLTSLIAALFAWERRRGA